MRARLSWIISLLVVLLMAAAYVVGGRPRLVARVDGRVLALAADAQGLLWLATRQPGPDGGGGLFALSGGTGTPHPLGSLDHLVAIAPAGGQVLALEVPADGRSGALVAIPRVGGPAVTRVAGLSRPQGLVAAGSGAYWTEALPAPSPHVWHVPALAPKVLVRSVALSGNASPRLLAVTEGSPAGFRSTLLGVAGERFYWIDFVGSAGGWGWSVTRAVPLAGGTVEAIRTDQGPQTGLLARGTLYATAPSEDAGDPLRFCCVRRSSPPEAAPTTLTDWLWPGGTLCDVGGRVHYASEDGVWSVPKRLARPRQLRPAIRARGPAVARSGAIYAVLGGPRGSVLLRQPVSPAARLRAAAQLVAGR